ncbi:putative ankyrin repeat protein RF_0381 isoform X2 [Saccostrea cucullata]|uniref:putative ankyrin repeat protein RF_0381 isoform X2 n=1 Tax=Saccostrea cuccullata TaxID=36930 RepID=UPI002ED5F5F5
MSKYLLDKEPDLVREVDNEGMSVLHTAASGGNIRLFQILLDIGLLPTKKTKSGESVLHLACKSGKLLMSKYLVDEYKQLLGEVDNEGNTVAHSAAYSGKIQLLILLQEEGVDVQARSNKGKTPLHVASEQSKIDLCRHLLNTSENEDLVKIKDKDDMSVLHSAAASGYIGLFKLYIDRGLRAADFTREGKSVLSFAARNCRIQMCKYIVEKYGELIWHIDNLGENVLHDAARGGNCKVFEIFISLGLRADTKNKKGETVLHIGCSNKKFKFCDYVLEKYPSLVEEEDNLSQKVLRDTSLDSLQNQYRFVCSSMEKEKGNLKISN